MAISTESILKSFEDAVLDLKDKSLYRFPKNCNFIGDNQVKKGSKKLLCFSSNDYLSLAHNRKVKKEAINAIKKFGTSCKSSRYIAGNNDLYQKSEQLLAKFYKMDAAIVFSSGYQAAIGTIPALVNKGDLVIADKLIHSCLIDGIKLSSAKMLRFKHNDYKHLKDLIKDNRDKYNKILIVCEEIYSMDGDCSDLAELEKISKRYNALLMIDSAHSLYDKGQHHPNSKNIIYLGTFSKALGGFGGYICSNEIIIDYLRNFAKSQIFSTALPPATLASNHQALKTILSKNIAKKTIKNTKYFCQLMQIEFQNSAIVIFEIESAEKALLAAQKIQQRGILITAIRPPTAATARLRITFNANHKKKEIEDLAEILKNIIC